VSIPLNKGYNAHVPHAPMNIPALSHVSVVFAILKITRPIDNILANKGEIGILPLIGKRQNKHTLFYLVFEMACLTIR